MCTMTLQYIFYDEKSKKVRHARTIKLLPDQLKWNATLIEEVEWTWDDEHIGHDQETVFQNRPSKPGDGDKAKSYQE